MRYIKSYKVFENFNFDIIKNDIENILYPLNDIGIESKIESNDIGNNILIKIFKRVKTEGSFYFSEKIYYEEINDELSHIISYMESNGYQMDIIGYRPWKDRYSQEKIIQNLNNMSGEEISLINIKFKKIN